MDIRVAGHQVETGQAFRVHVDERMQTIRETYFKRSIGATVTLSPGPHDSFQCDIVMHVMQGVVLKGSNRAALANTAFDGAADKIEKQLRRYMRRLKDKTGGLSLAELPLADVPDNAEYRIFEAAADEVEAPDAPLTIAETRVDIPDASVSDAVMMLDLRNTTALLFKNSRTGDLNMVYRREDGNIGWVEPRS
ncbi:ribosome-associated translation inhibitor RaiA [Sandaracinobacter neustonicus]|uniref:Ribosome hibernation promoting factor n=1 Tax=Sandaracinobacter neustonicus TaxID=1715348 RepID=A0A501XRC2_9SPHN|nr:ribosome-associated translation inhibitor RaiA [Sandaracinobacter neustonicus]TPE63292.1 ribosome-associated translation inhibitor RaiA [Sandaracinobacter neustonicus]